jgi:hypothetical protein
MSKNSEQQEVQEVNTPLEYQPGVIIYRNSNGTAIFGPNTRILNWGRQVEFTGSLARPFN